MNKYINKELLLTVYICCHSDFLYAGSTIMHVVICGCYYFVVKKHDASEKTRHDNVRHVGTIAMETLIDEAATAEDTTASYCKSETCDAVVSKQASKAGQCNPAEKVDMQDVVAALPVSAKEPRITAVLTGSSSVTGIASKMQMEPPRRLFRDHITKPLRDNMIETAEKSSSQAELTARSAAQAEDSSRGNKRCKFSVESGASHFSAGGDKQFDAKVDRETLGSASAGEKKGHARMQEAACNQIPLDTEQVPSVGGKGKQSELICSSARTEVSLTKDTRRSANGRGDMSAVAENWYNLRTIKSHCEVHASSNSLPPSTKASPGTQRCNWSKCSFESVASSEARRKANDTPEQKGGTNEQMTKSKKKNKKYKKNHNGTKMEVEDEVNRRHESDVKLNDSEKKVGDNQMTESAPIGRRYNTRRMEVEDEAGKRGYLYSRNTNLRSQNAQQFSSQYTSTGVSSHGRGRGSAQYKPGRSAGNQPGDHDAFAGAHSRESSSLNVERNWADDGRRQMHTDRGAGRLHSRGSSKLTRRVNACNSSTKTFVDADQHSGIMNSSENVYIVEEDWETDLLVQQNVTVSCENASYDGMGEMSRFEEAVTTLTFNSCTAASSKCSENAAEASGRSAQQTEVNMDLKVQHLALSGDTVNVGIDAGSEKIQSESNVAVKTEMHISHAETKEAYETAVSLEDNIEREAGMSGYDASKVNYHQLDVDKYNMQRKISTALTGDVESSDLPSETCEQYSASDDVIEPYKIGAVEIENNDFLSPQSEKCSDKISSGKVCSCCHFTICFFNIQVWPENEVILLYGL